MHFIEDWFGINPDGGSGALELLYFAVAFLALVMFALRRRARRAWQRQRDQ